MSAAKCQQPQHTPGIHKMLFFSFDTPVIWEAEL